MYNSIYPLNINYTKHNRYNQNGADNSAAKTKEELSKNAGGLSSDEKKAALYYSKGNINISQVLADFRNTIVAINAPEDVSEEVSAYLNLVEKESQKENPSKDIVISNLKNASKISDAYIAQALNKQSNVVENWITTLFKQPINLKANPDEINPDFLLKFPKKENNTQEISSEENQEENITEQQTSETVELSEENNDTQNEVKISNYSTQDEIEVQSELEITDNDESETDENFVHEKTSSSGAFSPVSTADESARELFIMAKNTPDTNEGDIDAVNFLNEALGILSDTTMESNCNIKAAIHLERGKLFDSYDYVDYALRDYFEATKAEDLNLKAQAFYKSGQIYDEFSEFNPALDNYLSSVAYSGEADNLDAQAHVLAKISSLYTKQFDSENTFDYTDLAVSMAQESDNNSTIANIYSTTAQNYQYLGENEKALNSYKEALKAFSRDDESYEQMAYNYEQAALVMEKLGNKAKASKLQLKANLYYQKAQLNSENPAIAS